MQRKRWERSLYRIGILTIVALAACVSGAAASQWNEKTVLTFSEPVMVPGATLQPGSYVFKLLNSTANRHTVEIATEDGSKVIAITQAVPMKRTDPKGDIVLKMSPTDAGSPPAIKGWYYPGSLYGHEFIYPENQAREIAARTKTIVLSIDVPGTDLEKGTIRLFNPSGQVTEWRADAATMREWDEWQRNRSTRMAGSNASAGERRQATAPMVEGDFQGVRVKLDALEDNPQKYMGQTISVDAAIEDVYGPRIFTIDEPHWGDLEGEILVYVPTTLAALVRENDRVTVTGTVKPFVKADVEHEWGWLGLDRDVEVDFSRKPVLVASRIVGGNNDVAMVINVDPSASKPVGTAGTSDGAPITDASAIASGDEDLVGRRVSLTGQRIDAIAKGGGFFVKGQNGSLFILPSHTDQADFSVGDTVSLSGVVLQMPSGMKHRVNAPATMNDDIYVYATNVMK